jgi:hypothetical protein
MLLVHITRPSARATYALEHLFTRLLGWPVRWAASLEELRSSELPRVLYGGTPVQGAFHLPSEPLIDLSGTEGEAAFRNMQAALRKNVPCAPLSTVFFFLSLWEEMRATRQDAHGRMPADDLTACRPGVDPLLVDRTAIQLADMLRARFPSLPPPQRRYSHVLTVDVDNGLRFLGRPMARAIGASARELLRGEAPVARDRWATRLGYRPDPYNDWSVPVRDVLGSVDRCAAFILTRGGGRHDHAARLEHPAFQQALRALPEAVETGLHPSYFSGMDHALVVEERERLRKVLDRPVRISRQHFLRMLLPDTYRLLLAAGFQEDHTLGLHDRTGFRAATCTPFPWYDLEREQDTDLMCWPFAVMDSALRERMGLGPEQALAEIDRVQRLVREVQGTFVSVWHDRYLSGYRNFAPWPGVLHRAAQLARA